MFFIWLSVTSFAGVLTGSSGMSIMAAFIVWMAQRILSFHEGIKSFTDSQVVRFIVDALYYIFPKTGEMFDLTDQAVSGNISSWMPLYSSLIFAVVLFFVTVAIFKRKDY